LVSAELEENVDVLGVFEEVFEADNVVVVEGAMDLNFGHQLCLGTTFSERRFHDDLGSLDLFVFEVRHFVALRKASLSEELALEVLFDYVVAVEFDDPLFDDGLRVFLGWDIGA